jgi:dTDP-glucose pyrophosphorylase
MKRIINHTIVKNVSCLEAMKQLDSEKSNQTLFILDENDRLVAAVTDGDIRRGLIKGLSVESEIIEFSNPNFCFIKENFSVSEIKALKVHGIKLLPKLNKDGKIEKVYDLSNLNSILPLHAVMMAGGRGERLRPLTDVTPKPMLLLGNKPIIEHNIDQLISFGIETVTISVNYLANQIIDYFGDGSSKGIKINYITETSPFGTIGSLSLMKDIEQSSILLLNSDLFTSINFEEFYLNYISNDADMAVASIPYSVEIPYAILDLEQTNIKGFKEKPKNTYYANAGIYLFKAEYLNLIPKETVYNATDLMDLLIKRKMNLIHSPITGFWIDIGKHDDYKKAQEIIKHL